VEKWKDGRMEGWKDGRMEDWRVGGETNNGVPKLALAIG
jgi:hypothetical protein